MYFECKNENSCLRNTLHLSLPGNVTAYHAAFVPPCSLCSHPEEGAESFQYKVTKHLWDPSRLSNPLSIPVLLRNIKLGNSFETCKISTSHVGLYLHRIT